MKKRILLTDGTTQGLEDLQPELVAREPAWDWLYARTGLDALDHLTRGPCDALVVDLQLTDMSGLQLVTQVMKQYPQLHRVLLADLGDVESLLRCVGNVHQFLVKPCEAERLHLVLTRAFELDAWLPDQMVRQLIGRIPRLPSPAETYTAVVKELQSETPSLPRVARWIAEDPPMTAKILQLANSAAFGPVLDEADPVRAVRELGLENAKSVLLLAHSYSSFREAERGGFSPAALWEHSRRTGVLARAIAQAEPGPGTLVQQAATAGLLHDLGKVALAANLAPQYGQVLSLVASKGRSSWEAEQEVLGATHGEVGGCLLGNWGLPLPVVEAVALHHHPTRFLSETFSPLTAVHVANALEHAGSLEEVRQLVDLEYLQQLGLESRLAAWWELSRTEAVRAPAPTPGGSP